MGHSGRVIAAPLTSIKNKMGPLLSDDNSQMDSQRPYFVQQCLLFFLSQQSIDLPDPCFSTLYIYLFISQTADVSSFKVTYSRFP